MGPISQLSEFDNFNILIGLGLGYNKTRWKMYQLSLELDFKMPVVKHIKSIISENVFIAAGSVLFVGTIINTSVSIGEASIINTGSIIEHDCIVGNAVHISPGAILAGVVYVEDFTWIGMGEEGQKRVKELFDERIVVAQGMKIYKDLIKEYKSS